MPAHPQRTETELACAARAGSATAFDELVRIHHGRVFGFLLALTRHRQDAEDLTQQAFIRGWRKIHRLDPARPVLPWLLTIARRESIVALRRRRPPLTGWPAADPWAAAAGDPPARRLWELAARTLPRDACAALWLHYREELPLDDVGRILGKRTGAVKTMLHRARTRLAQAATQVVPPPPPPPPLPAAGRHLPPPLPARWSAVSMP